MECKCYVKEEDGVEPQIIKCPLCKSASDLYEALWTIRTQFCKVDKLYSKDCDAIEQANKALTKAESKR